MPSESSSETLHPVTIKVGDDQQEVVFAQLTLDEKMLEPGHFSFIWKNEFGDTYSNDQQKFIEDFIGKSISIQLSESFIFKGIITQIAYSQNDGLTQDYRVNGMGNGVLISDHIHSASYYKKTISQMVDTCLEGIPSNLLSIENSPKHTDEKFYTVQYAETDYSFLVNLAVRFGEWFYYNGEKLIFGEINTEAYTLEAGSEVTDIVFSSAMRPTNLNVVGLNYYEGQELNAAAEAPSPSGLYTALQDMSSSVYSRTPEKKQYNPNFPTQQSLDDWSSLELQARSSRLIQLSASTRNAQIRVGTTLEIKFPNKSEKYIITQVNHQSNGLQDYSNHFLAFPASITIPHYTNPSWYPKAQTQSALVKDNEDKDGMDRVKVHFPWQQDNANTPWLRVQNPYAGKGKGFRFVPEKEEEVMIGFENGNAEKPYVIGALFHGAATSGHHHESNHIKIFRTGSGSRMMFNDQNGSIKITDKAGSYILLNGGGDIEIVAQGNLKVTSADKTEITVGTDLSATVGAKGDITIGDKAAVTIAKDLTVTVGAKVELTAGSDLKTTSGAATQMTAGSDFQVTAGVNAELTGGAGFKATGGATAEIVGGTSTKVSSGAMLDLSAGAAAKIQAAIVQIN